MKGTYVRKLYRGLWNQNRCLGQAEVVDGGIFPDKSV